MLKMTGSGRLLTSRVSTESVSWLIVVADSRVILMELPTILVPIIKVYDL